MRTTHVKPTQDEPCDTCGDVGYGEMIAICTNCYTREHVYCMRVDLSVVPKDWVCELCLSNDMVLPEAGGTEETKRTMTLDSFDIGSRERMRTAGPSSGWQAYSKRHKPSQTGKVKFIGTDEVIKLSSATQLQTNFGSRSGPSCSTALSQRNQVGSRTAIPKSSIFRVKANRSLVPSGLVKPPSCSGVQNSSMVNQKAPQVSKNLKGNGALVASKKEPVCEKPVVDALIPKEVETSNTKIEKAKNEASHTPSSLRISSLTPCPGNGALVAAKKDLLCEKPVVDVPISKEVETSNTKREKVKNVASRTPPSLRLSSPTTCPGNGALVAAKKELFREKPVVDALIPKEVETSNSKLEKVKNEASHTPPSLRLSSPTTCPRSGALVAAAKMELVCEKPVVDALIPKEVETSNTKIEKEKNEASHTLSSLKLSSLTACPGGKFQVVGGKHENSDAEESDLLNILPKFKLYCNFLPARHATWRGGVLVTATRSTFYGGFRAQPPRTVSRQAFEFSQRLPLVLPVTLLPRSQIWADLFQNDCPDLNDIALYFSPDNNIQRSQENSACLFELMEVQNVIMRACINGVDLLIFTSKQLHVDSQNVIASFEAGFSFWGIFRPVEDNQTQQLTHSSIGVAPERVIDKYLDFPWNVKAGSNRFSLNCKNGPGVYRLS